MAAVSASPPIRVTAPAFIAGREAGLSIKPLIARNGQRYGAGGDGDCWVFDQRCWSSFLYAPRTNIIFGEETEKQGLVLLAQLSLLELQV